jgi:hypothetical protein
MRKILSSNQRGAPDFAEPDREHCEKSMISLHLPQVWGLSNSSEKISFSSPHLGHLQTNDSRFLKLANPGQWAGVLVASVIVISFRWNGLFYLVVEKNLSE